MKIVFVEPIGLSDSQKKMFSQKMELQGNEVVYFDSIETDQNRLKQRIADANVLVVANQKISEDVIASAIDLQFISVAFTGVDHLPLNYCHRKRIVVSNAAGYSTNAVAELAIASAIDLYRRITPFDKTTRSGGTRAGFLGTELSGKTFGLLGFGAIAKRVAELSLAFGCKVISHNRSIKEHEGVEFVSIDSLFHDSDIVSIHIPACAQTNGLVNSKLIGLMKPSALFINTARGTIVDSAALAEALKRGRIAGAAIDVYESEPPLNASHPLLTAPNTLLLPHIGFATKEAIEVRSQIAIGNIEGWLSNAPNNIVEL